MPLPSSKTSAPVAPEVILSKLNIPAEFGDKILTHLTGKGLIAKTSDPRIGFLPAKDPANIKLSDIAEAVAAASFAQVSAEQSQTLDQVAQSQRTLLAKYSVKQIL